MPASYCYVLDSNDLMEFQDLTGSQRRQLMRYFDNLAENPFQKGENSYRTPAGREIQIKSFGRWSVYYWVDHAVKEVRITGFEKTGRDK